MARLVRMNSRSGAFANLCDEEIYEIFKFLSLRERKNARLVCKQWNQVLSEKSFAEKEILCIPNWYSLSSVGEILNNNSMSKLTLKFVCRNFDASSKVLWKTLGSKIKSLHFDWCTFHSEGLLHIFNYCVNLEEFSARNSLFTTKPGWIFVIYKNAIVSTFSFGDKLIRDNLQKFHFDSGSSSACFRERDLFVIASIFPKLKTLEIQLMLNYEDSKMKAYIPRYHISFNKLKYIETFDIELHIPHPSLLQYHQFINFEKMCKLDFKVSRTKNIRLNLSNFLLRVENLDRILSYKYWTSLVLFEINLHPHTNVIVVADLLNKMPFLETFKLCLIMKTETDVEIRIINILFPALVKSKLTNLYIEIPKLTDLTDTDIANIGSSWDNSLLNYTVRHLKISESGHSGSHLSSLFVKHFLGIRELTSELGNPDIIFEYQKHLQSLTLYMEDNSRIGNKILQLSSLQIIKIFNCQPNDWTLFKTHRFPNLKYLLLSNCKTCNDENAKKNQEDSIEKFESLLSSIPLSCPNVEIFEFRWEGYTEGFRACQMPGILQLCQKFQQLRYLSLKINYKECLQSKKSLKQAIVTHFKQHSSLRAIWLQLCCINLLAFINIVTKKCEFSEGNLTLAPELYAHSWMFK